MTRAIVVPQREIEDVWRYHAKQVKRARIEVFGIDFGNRNAVVPIHRAGLLFGAEVCFVGISQGLVEELCGQFQIEVYDFLKGAVRDNQRTLRDWLHVEDTVEPTPSYTQIVEAARDSYPTLRVASAALVHANRVSADPSDDAEEFPAFLEEGLRALVGAGGKLDEYFAQYAPLSVFASSGAESFKCTVEIKGQLVAMKDRRMHLKPKSERAGYRDSRIKPRLYFDFYVVDGTQNALVLYFGPHPQGRGNDAGVVEIRDE